MLSREGVRRALLLARRDLRDLRRDYRTLAAIIILPFIGLPGLALLTGALSQAQEVLVCVRLEDSSAPALNTTREIVEGAVEILQYWGLKPQVSWGEGSGPCDILVRVPPGFSENLTRLDGVAVLEVSSSLTAAGQQALSALRISAERVGERIALERVERLAGMAGVSVEPGAVLDPVRVEVEYHTAGGAPAGREQVEIAEAARVLAFSLFFVVNPVIVFMSDSIAGERERRTLEVLLISPLTRWELIAGKVAASGVAGLLGALADSTGLLLYFALQGFQIRVSLGLMLVWLASVGGLILFSSFLAGIIASRSRSIRASQNLSFLATTLAMMIYFAALVVDYSRLPVLARALMSLVPFTHAALALNYYAVGLPSLSLAYLALLYLSSAITGLLAVKLFDAERMLS